ncbi:hypothetical protein F5Y05DRAFT_392660 [Hypoxylon sp. FL0543]|nr:hypothetical protein F5Y05DRAFT_392660 [Hypoxylon sp. FL0543]
MRVHKLEHFDSNGFSQLDKERETNEATRKLIQSTFLYADVQDIRKVCADGRFNTHLGTVLQGLGIRQPECPMGNVHQTPKPGQLRVTREGVEALEHRKMRGCLYGLDEHGLTKTVSARRF